MNYRNRQSKSLTREAATVDFSPKGDFIAVVAKDKNHSFYFFSLADDSLAWTEPTSKEVICEMAFHPTKNECVLVGINTIIFVDCDNKTMTKNPNNQMEGNALTHTNAEWTTSGTCFTTTTSGHVCQWYNNKIVKSYRVSEVALHSACFHVEEMILFTGDGNGFLYKVNLKTGNIIDSNFYNHVVKSVDVNSKGDKIVGLRDGTIMLKNAKEKLPKVLQQNHADGRITDLDFIPDNLVPS